MDGCKVVDGKSQFMGTLSCDYHPDRSLLTCTGHTGRRDEWEFQVSGDTMSGTLKVGPEKTLYRRINVHKTQTKLTCP